MSWLFCVPKTCTSTRSSPDIPRSVPPPAFRRERSCTRTPQSTESLLPNHAPFRPAWWLPGPHLPTVWGKFARRLPDAHDRIERWPTPDGDAVSVARLNARSADAPLILILHGLEGTVRSKYAQGLMHQAKARGWGAAMLIFRSCDGRVPDAPRAYHSGETTDVDLVVRRLIAEQPARTIHLVGVSLGANVLLKWLGEQGDGVPSGIARAAAISTPFDLAEGSRFLERGFSRVYVRHFVRSLKRKADAALARHPAMPADRVRLAAARSFWDFDDAFTGPVHGFRDAADYYARSSSIHFLERIRIPTLLHSAVDDPFLPPEVLVRVRGIAEGNPALRTDFTQRGGHVGWVSGQPWAPVYAMEPRVMQWFEQGS